MIDTGTEADGQSLTVLGRCWPRRLLIGAFLVFGATGVAVVMADSAAAAESAHVEAAVSSAPEVGLLPSVDVTATDGPSAPVGAVALGDAGQSTQPTPPPPVPVTPRDDADNPSVNGVDDAPADQPDTASTDDADPAVDEPGLGVPPVVDVVDVVAEPAKPAVGLPAKPAVGQPAKPAVGLPAKPVVGLPAKPVVGQPAKPVVGQPAVGQPAKPAVGQLAAGATAPATAVNGSAVVDPPVPPGPAASGGATDPAVATDPVSPTGTVIADPVVTEVAPAGPDAALSTQAAPSASARAQSVSGSPAPVTGSVQARDEESRQGWSASGQAVAGSPHSAGAAPVSLTAAGAETPVDTPVYPSRRVPLPAPAPPAPPVPTPCPGSTNAGPSHNSGVHDVQLAGYPPIIGVGAPGSLGTVVTSSSALVIGRADSPGSSPG